MSKVIAPVLSAHWTEILDHVQKTLAQTEAEAIRSAQALDEALATAGGSLGGPADPGQPSSRLQDATAAADRTAAQVDEALAASEAALRRWLEEAEAIRRKLAKDAAPSV